MSQQIQLKVKPTKVQSLFLSCPADNILYGGAVGGGKSYISVVKAFTLAMKYKGIHIGLFRKTLKEVEESLLLYCQELYPKQLYNYVSSKRKLTFINGSRITINYIDNNADLSLYDGIEFQVLILDEAIKQTDYQLSKIKSRLRYSKAVAGFKPRCFYMTNPIGVGQGYLKEKFITGKEPYKIYYEYDEATDTTESYCYIPAKLTDNPYLMKNDPGYTKRLMDLPEHERDALINGIWDSEAGRFFPSWKKQTHVIDSFTPTPMDYCYIAIDWGTAKPFSVGWYCMTNEDRIIRYREYYGIRGKVADEGIGLQAEVVAQHICDRTPLSENIRYIVLDNACWADHGVVSIYEAMYRIFQKRKFSLMKCTKNRVNGLENIKRWMSLDKSGVPYFQVTKDCYHFQRIVENVVASDRHDGDIQAGQEDHCFIADTMISTEHGNVPIQDVELGTFVLTSKGYRPVTKLHKHLANVKLYSFTSGLLLIATPNHPIYFNGIYIPIDRLDYYDTIDTCDNELNILMERLRSLSITESGIVGIHKSDTIGQVHIELLKDIQAYIDRYTLTQMELFLKGMTYIIKTMTMIITKLVTSNVLMHQNIEAIMSIKESKKKELNRSEQKWNMLEHSQTSGMEQKKERSFIQSMQRSIGKIHGYLKTSVSVVVRSLKVNIIKARFALDIVQIKKEINLALITFLQTVLYVVLNLLKISTLKLRHAQLLAKSNLENKQLVYNLSVYEHNEYYANTIRVHNCLDECAYMLNTRPFPNKQLDKELLHGTREYYKNGGNV